MRGKNATFYIYLHKCSETIGSAIQWLISQSIRNSLSDNFSGDSPPYSNSNYLFVWQDFGFKKVATSTITHLCASRSYCEIHLTNAPTMVVSVPMSEVGKHLNQSNFIRIHRSFIINLQHVDALVGNMTVMEDGSKLSISKEYRSVLLRYFCFVGSKSQKFTL